MPAPVIYRSTDANAPALFGLSGSLISLLDAILVNGYGSTFASGTIINDGVNPSDGDTVTVGSVTYTFKLSLTGAVPGWVNMSGTVSTTVANLRDAINGTGTPGSTYATGTSSCPEAYVSLTTATTLTLTARRGGSGGNVPLARAAAGTPHFSVSGATLTGGGGTDTKAGAGWTKSFTGTPSWQQSVYRQPAGCRFYLQVDDSGPGSGATREARCFGFEAMTAYNVGTGQFPTVTQIAAGAVIRKSSLFDNTARAWIAFADDRTFYLFILSGDSAGNYAGFSFGDFYSLVPGDVYKCLIMGGSVETPSTISASQFGQHAFVVSGTGQVGHWLPRNYSGFGGSTNFVKAGDTSLSSGTTNLFGAIGLPNASDGGLYLMPLRIIDGSSPGTTPSGTLNLRGRVRGLYQVCVPATAFSDGDTFPGSGAYAGRTFQVVKQLHGTAVNLAFAAIETTAWAVST